MQEIEEEEKHACIIISSWIRQKMTAAISRTHRALKHKIELEIDTPPRRMMRFPFFLK